MDDEMTDERNPPEAELARLADGSLPGPREAELRAQVKASPELTAALAEQERAVAMLRALDQPAPASLRARVEELTGAGAGAGAVADAGAGAGGTGGVGARGRPARRRLMRWPPVLVLPGVTALAVAVAAVVILAGGSTSAPTVPQAARLALASATLPAPGVDSADHDQLDVSAAGIPFPNWATTSRWTTSGARRDRVGGRTVTTVYYRDPNGTEVGYAISSGAPLAGAHGTAVRRYGATFTLQHIGGANFITWTRAGHTCVIAGNSVPYATLLRLAGADGGAAVGSQAAVERTHAAAGQYL